jgi:hypothetical protein
MSTFSEAVKSIETAYEKLGHDLGWRFLYSPANTIGPDTRMVFLGLNPGGSHYEAPVPSVEEGNAYRIEHWGKDGGHNGLQTQVHRLYEILARKVGQQSAPKLMDQTLTANFCPFRSPNWKSLSRKRESVRFSHELWFSVLDRVSPSVIICLSDMPFDYVESVLLARGFRIIEKIKPLTGWGDVTYSQAKYSSLDEKEVLMVRLPHLSRYKIFGKPECRRAVDQLTDEIVRSLRT